MSDTHILAGRSTFPHNQHSPEEFTRESARLARTPHFVPVSTDDRPLWHWQPCTTHGQCAVELDFTAS
jgi:hypothetical protein